MSPGPRFTERALALALSEGAFHMSVFEPEASAAGPVSAALSTRARLESARGL